MASERRLKNAYELRQRVQPCRPSSWQIINRGVRDVLVAECDEKDDAVKVLALLTACDAANLPTSLLESGWLKDIEVFVRGTVALHSYERGEPCGCEQCQRAVPLLSRLDAAREAEHE